MFFMCLQNQSLKKIEIFSQKWKKIAFFEYHSFCSKITKNNFFCMMQVCLKNSRYFKTFDSWKFFSCDHYFLGKWRFKFKFFENVIFKKYNFFFFSFGKYFHFFSSSDFASAWNILFFLNSKNRICHFSYAFSSA